MAEQQFKNSGYNPYFQTPTPAGNYNPTPAGNYNPTPAGNQQNGFNSGYGQMNYGQMNYGQMNYGQVAQPQAGNNQFNPYGQSSFSEMGYNQNSGMLNNGKITDKPGDIPEEGMSTETIIYIVVGVITLVILIVFGIFVGVTYANKTYIFEPYVPGPNTANLILYNANSNTPLTPEQEAQRAEMIKSAQDRLKSGSGVNNPYVTNY